MKTDTYRKIRQIGEGGNGAVWLVEDNKTGQQKAMKLILPEATLDKDKKALFIRECRYACQLKHPNIVEHYVFNKGKNTYLLMEYCQGGNVNDLIRRNPGIFWDDLTRMDERIQISTRIILQALEGLEYAHQKKVVARLADGSTLTVKGIVHRDFEPGNILLTDTSLYPIAKVADFGLAKAFLTAGLTKYNYTDDREGKPWFIPRQQVIDLRNVKPEVDVWAAAASYYYLLTGYYPKNIIGALDPFEASLDEEPVPILIRNPRIPVELAKVIDAALRERPQIGIQTAGELKEAIIKITK